MLKMLAPIALPNAPFTRYQPFADGRVIVVRRGNEPARHRGLEVSRRQLVLDGVRVTLVRFRQLLSPPAANPNIKPLSKEARCAYSPESEVLYLPGAEVSIPREPAGFTDDEVTAIALALQRGLAMPV